MLPDSLYNCNVIVILVVIQAPIMLVLPVAWLGFMTDVLQLHSPKWVRVQGFGGIHDRSPIKTPNGQGFRVCGVGLAQFDVMQSL